MPPLDPSQGNVALFIDWENFKYSLYEVSRLPNIPALIQAVQQRYGRPTVARAYADWQDYYHRRSWDQMSLYQSGVEPVYVPSRRSPFGQDRVKNSVDVKMSLDCLEVSFTDPQVRTFVLVAGDADFLHVAAALRRRGMKVIMIGVSGSTSSRLKGIVDEIVLYDEDIDGHTEDQDQCEEETEEADRPALRTTGTEAKLPVVEHPSVEQIPKPMPNEHTTRIAAPEMTLEEVQGRLLSLIREQRESEGGRNYPPMLSWLGMKLRERTSWFNVNKHGLERFKDLVSEMQTQGLLLVETNGSVKRVWLPEDRDQAVLPPSLPPAVAAALAEPDDIPATLRADFADIVMTADDIENSSRDYMAKGLLARFLYNKGHWNPSDLPPQAAPPRSDHWKSRELPEIYKIIEDALDMGLLRYKTYIDPYNGNEIAALELEAQHPFVRKTFAETQMP